MGRCLCVLCASVVIMLENSSGAGTLTRYDRRR